MADPRPDIPNNAHSPKGKSRWLGLYRCPSEDNVLHDRASSDARTLNALLRQLGPLPELKDVLEIFSDEDNDSSLCTLFCYSLFTLKHFNRKPDQLYRKFGFTPNISALQNSDDQTQMKLRLIYLLHILFLSDDLHQPIIKEIGIILHTLLNNDRDVTSYYNQLVDMAKQKRANPLLLLDNMDEYGNVALPSRKDRTKRLSSPTSLSVILSDDTQPWQTVPCRTSKTPPPDRIQFRPPKPMIEDDNMWARLRDMVDPPLGDPDSDPDHEKEDPHTVHPAYKSDFRKLLSTVNTSTIQDHAKVKELACHFGLFLAGVHKFDGTVVRKIFSESTSDVGHTLQEILKAQIRELCTTLTILTNPAAIPDNHDPLPITHTILNMHILIYILDDGTVIGNLVERAKDTLVSTVDYSGYDRFRDRTPCPYARRAWHYYAAPWNGEDYPTYVASVLTEFQLFVHYLDNGQSFDTFIVLLPAWCGETLDSLSRFFVYLLDGLNHDALFDDTGRSKMEDPSWQFNFGTEEFFVTSLGPCYPENHSRHDPEHMFIVFHPSSSLAKHHVPRGIDAPYIRNKARTSFERAGRAYPDFAIFTNPDLQKIDAFRMVKPIDPNGTVTWWDELNNPLPTQPSP